MKHMLFLVGDIVMLKEPNKYKNTYFKPLNLFKIEEVSENRYSLQYIDGIVSKNDVLPVPIDGFHDREIYFDYIPNAYVTYDDIIPAKERDTRYYIDTIKEIPILYEQIKNLSYVHEVQHIIKDLRQRRWISLNINNY